MKGHSINYRQQVLLMKVALLGLCLALAFC